MSATPPNAFYPSIEGAQHGDKSLLQFLQYAAHHGARGAQPSNYMLNRPGGKSGQLLKVGEIRDAFASSRLHIDGISAHCPFWVHTSIWTGTKSGNPFISADVLKMSPKKIEQWHESYLLKLMDLSAELGVKTMPMFWGVAFGLEMASGYPWGFWAGPDPTSETGKFDLLAEGKDRFREKTRKLRQHANQLDIDLCHEIHPGTAASTADDFNMLVNICADDKCLSVNADPSHCWEGESWETRFLKVGSRVNAAHIKNFVIRPGFPLRSMQGAWPKRAMQFTDLGTGDLNMQRYAELLLHVGYRDRYCKRNGTTSAPLVVEAESAHQGLDHCSADGIRYVGKKLCWPAAAGSFEDAMGDKGPKKK